MNDKSEDDIINCLGIRHKIFDNSLVPTFFNKKKVNWLRNNYIPSKNEIWIVTYPKNGTTLTQQICHEIMHCCYNKTNSNSSIHSFYKSNEKHLNISEWIENKYGRKNSNDFNTFINKTKNTKRFWKSHAIFEQLPCKILPKKIIIVCRNPKDTITSFYYHSANHKNKFCEGFNTFFTIFVAGLHENNSYFDWYKKYWNFYIDSKKGNSEAEVHWIWYENLIENKREEIKRLIKFIGVDDVVNSEDDINMIINNTTVEKMKEQYKDLGVIKNFVRKGKIGDWKRHFNWQQNQIVNALIQWHFRGTQFKYYKDLLDNKQYLRLSPNNLSKL